MKNEMIIKTSLEELLNVLDARQIITLFNYYSIITKAVFILSDNRR